MACKAGEGREYCEALRVRVITKSTYFHVNLSGLLACCVPKAGGVAGWRGPKGSWIWWFGALTRLIQGRRENKVVFRKIKVPTVPCTHKYRPGQIFNSSMALKCCWGVIGRSLLKQEATQVVQAQTRPSSELYA